MDKSHKHVTGENFTAKKKMLFKVFCNEEVIDLNIVKSYSYLKKNQLLFSEGSMPKGVYCLNKGKVKIFSKGEEGKEQIIHVAKEGEVVGFRAMFSEEPYKVNASTLEESNICFIRKADFLHLVDTNASLRNGIMKKLSTELVNRVDYITNMAQKSVRGRLAFVLILLKEIYTGEMINLTREDLANFVGTTTETLIRLLMNFKNEKLIQTHGRKIEILNLDELIVISGT